MSNCKSKCFESHTRERRRWNIRNIVKKTGWDWNTQTRPQSLESRVSLKPTQGSCFSEDVSPFRGWSVGPWTELTNNSHIDTTRGTTWTNSVFCFLSEDTLEQGLCLDRILLFVCVLITPECQTDLHKVHWRHIVNDKWHWSISGYLHAQEDVTNVTAPFLVVLSPWGPYSKYGWLWYLWLWWSPIGWWFHMLSKRNSSKIYLRLFVGFFICCFFSSVKFNL